MRLLSSARSRRIGHSFLLGGRSSPLDLDSRTASKSARPSARVGLVTQAEGTEMTRSKRLRVLAEAQGSGYRFFGFLPTIPMTPVTRGCPQTNPYCQRTEELRCPASTVLGERTCTLDERVPRAR